MNIQEKGITLIALVITIIVLLILAGVSISAVTNREGIFVTASKAKIEMEHASVLEKLRLKIYEKAMDLENEQNVIEYLKEQGIIREPEVVEGKQQASIGKKIMLTEEVETIKYIVNVEKLIKNPSMGKGNLETGDVYYIYNGDLHYLSSALEERNIGLAFPAGTIELEEADESWFSYKVDANDEVEITGFNFSKIEYEKAEGVKYHGVLSNDAALLGVDVLVIPSQINGKNVTKVGFHSQISDEDGYSPRIIRGVKKIVYPKTMLTLGAAHYVFEDLEEIRLQEGVHEIEDYAFHYWLSVKQINIPSSVRRILGKPFVAWDRSATIVIEGKNSQDDFEELGARWNFCYYSSQSEVFIENIKYLGK